MANPPAVSPSNTHSRPHRLAKDSTRSSRDIARQSIQTARPPDSDPARWISSPPAPAQTPAGITMAADTPRSAVRHHKKQSRLFSRLARPPPQQIAFFILRGVSRIEYFLRRPDPKAHA